MIGSRVKLLLCAAALASMPAAAQWSSDKPPVLGQDDYPPLATEDAPDPPRTDAASQGQLPPPDGATGEPQQLQGPPPATQVESLPEPGPSGVRSSVEVDALGTPEGPPVGTLETPSGGLGEHIWSGSDRAKIVDLLQRAPLAVGDPVTRDLTRRLILTRASAPPGTAPRAFNTVRIRKLLDAGLIEEAGALASMAQVPNDPEFARLQADALLIAGRSADVCGSATSTRLADSDVFWMQLRAFCAAVNGDTLNAELTRQVLSAQGKDDPAYNTLVDDVLNRQTVQPGALAHPSAMHLYLMQQAGLPVPEAMARTMGTAANVLAMRDARNPPRARFEAAERVVMTGAASAAELKAIAEAQDLPLAKVANAAADAPNLPFFMGQVLLRRAATIEPRPDAKARLVALALSLGEKQNMLPLAAALQADVIAGIKLSATSGEYTRTFARALVLAGRADVAARWGSGDRVMRTVAALASQDPARFAAVQVDLAAFADDLTRNPPPADNADRSLKALVLGVADALNLPMPPDAKGVAASMSSQMWDGRRPGPGTMRTIAELADQPERRGEALLLMLGAIHSIGLRDLAPDATIEFVRLLAGMNEMQGARSLAFEALAQYVPPPPPAPTASVQ